MADTLISSAIATELNKMCPSAEKAALGTAILAAVNALGVSASDTTITIADGTDTIAIGSTTAGAVSILSDGTITIGDTTATTSITLISAGALDLGKAGQATTVKGTLNVDQAASFDTTVQIGTTATAALALGGGTSSTKLTSASTGKNFVGFWTESTDATGSDMRGMYFRHYLAGAGGAQSGEAIRAYCTVSASAANAARGIHSSLSFGTSGDVAGFGAAVDGTLHVPNGNLGGTTAAVSAEINADGASSNNTGTMSLFRGAIQGDSSGVAALQDTYFLHLEGVTVGDGNMIETNTAADATHSLRCKIGDTVYYMLLSTNP